MKKRAFLAPLAVSVAALLGATSPPAQAKVDQTPAAIQGSPAAADSALVLRRADGAGLRVADHESHASHESHSSHSSHSSHVSGS